jgi:hypothetical protein
MSCEHSRVLQNQVIYLFQQWLDRDTDQELFGKITFDLSPSQEIVFDNNTKGMFKPNAFMVPNEGLAIGIYLFPVPEDKRYCSVWHLIGKEPSLRDYTRMFFG